jgi:hypothetical protein
MSALVDAEHGTMDMEDLIDLAILAIQWAGSTLRKERDTAAVSPSLQSGASGLMLGFLARFLPAERRYRFVAEELGNLAVSGHWRQRAIHLVGLVLGTPRLAWVMRREGRRGRV